MFLVGPMTDDSYDVFENDVFESKQRPRLFLTWLVPNVSYIEEWTMTRMTKMVVVVVVVVVVQGETVRRRPSSDQQSLS